MSWWAGGTLHGGSSHQCMNGCEAPSVVGRLGKRSTRTSLSNLYHIVISWDSMEWTSENMTAWARLSVSVLLSSFETIAERETVAVKYRRFRRGVDRLVYSRRVCVVWTEKAARPPERLHIQSLTSTLPSFFFITIPSNLMHGQQS